MKTNKEQNNKKKGAVKREIAEKSISILVYVVIGLLVLLSGICSFIAEAYGSIVWEGVFVCGSGFFALIAIAVYIYDLQRQLKKQKTQISELSTRTEEYYTVQYNQIKEEIEKEMRRKMIVERARISNQAEHEKKKENDLRLEILSRLSMREMTGNDAYKIMQELFSQSIGELEDTLSDLMSGEEEVRNKLFKRICKTRDLSDEERSKTQEFLETLNLSGLEAATDVIFKEDIAETGSKEASETADEEDPEAVREDSAEETPKTEQHKESGMDEITVGDKTSQFGYPDEEAQNEVKDEDTPNGDTKSDMHEVVFSEDAEAE